MTIYTVRPGDTVYTIARDQGINVDRLLSDNGIEDPDSLVVGQSLVILRPSTVYTVRPGDTVYDIASRSGVSVNSIYRNNPMLGGLPNITPGQVLVIEYDTPKRGRIIVNGYAYPYIDRSVLRKTLPYLTYLTIFGYGMTQDGELIPTDDDELIDIARSYGTSPVMLVSSLGEGGTFSNELVSVVLSNSAARENLIDNIVSTLVAKRYDAVDVDFEYILAQDREAYIRFINDLRVAANERGKRVFVSLAPKTSADQPGLLYEAHDYRALGSAADRALLMTYEWGYTYGPPMAISPINKVSEVVNYAKTEIPENKLVMGMPNYAYDWGLPFIQGESAATALSNVAAVMLASDTDSEIMFDETAQTPFFSYTDENGVRHEVWFEDARSVLAKLDLILSENLAGASVWQIMRYFPAMWAVLNSSVDIVRTGDEDLTNI
ncbi:MAG: LysM peptidoglycan-binding domain-containing protein [Clostridia bacterium]|nr:LysM peptidoglycan-binding domain-containing protein [Clostridia bacterium]